MLRPPKDFLYHIHPLHHFAERGISLPIRIISAPMIQSGLIAESTLR